MKTAILTNRGNGKVCFMKTKTSRTTNSMNRPLWRCGFVLIALILTGFVLSPAARAACREGCLTSANTVLGDDALLNNTGFGNTAIGAGALLSNTTGGDNTANGYLALYNNTEGFDNTAIGELALYNNTTGANNTATGFNALQHDTGSSLGTGSDNTATGVNALQSNTLGNSNTATGVFALESNTFGNGNTATGGSALQSNTVGGDNTATGSEALGSNINGGGNTANGVEALVFNTSGRNNTANGYLALESNTTGSSNTANGANALQLNSGSNNTGEGYQALFHNTMGGSNIALGFQAGMNLTTGTNNIDIGNQGVAGESNKIRIGHQGTQNGTFIAGIYNVAVTGSTVVVNSSGKLGVTASSARFKEAIKPMDKASEAILALKPVMFRYKKEVDAERTPQFGLVAEQVEKVNPDLVTRDPDGKAFTVRYEAVNAMLLNEFLKEHRKIEQLTKEFQATVAQQQKQIEALTAGLQKVSAQIEMSRSAPQIVLNNQ